ncbi:MAG TPA: MFS transporter, partial [Segeticoccus sp.]|nr:MFS transporter [Segeticoccus sp.]
YAAGSSLAGQLADWGGHTPAFAVTVLAGSIATVAALAGARPVRRARRAADPAVAEDARALTPA